MTLGAPRLSRQDQGLASLGRPLGEGPASPGEGAPGEASVMTPLGWGPPCGARGPSSPGSTLVTPKVALRRAPGTPRAWDPDAQGIGPQGASSSLPFQERAFRTPDWPGQAQSAGGRRPGGWRPRRPPAPGF